MSRARRGAGEKVSRTATTAPGSPVRAWRAGDTFQASTSAKSTKGAQDVRRRQKVKSHGDYSTDRQESCAGDTFQIANPAMSTTCGARKDMQAGEKARRTATTAPIARASHAQATRSRRRPAQVHHCGARKTWRRREGHVARRLQDRSLVRVMRGDTFQTSTSHKSTTCGARKTCGAGTHVAHDGSYMTDRGRARHALLTFQDGKSKSASCKLKSTCPARASPSTVVPIRSAGEHALSST